MRSQRNSIYNKILYILFLWVHIQRSPVKSLTAWWHYDQTVWCPVNRCRTGGLFEGPMRGRAGASCFFWQTSANSLQKPTTLSANSHKSFQQNFHQTFSNFPQTFSKGPKKGWKSGLLSLFLSPTFPRPSEIRRARKFPIPLHRQLRATRPADGAGLYSPHSAVSPPAPASWQSNRSITKGREKARRKTKKRTMRISHSQGHGSETIAWIWRLFSH